MSDVVGEALRDLGEEGRLERSSNELARASWAAGRRRRLRARLIVVAVGAAVVALLVLAVPFITSLTVQPVTPAQHQAVSGYPTFIAAGRPSAVLPSRPGPIAGVLEDRSWGDTVSYFAVTSTRVRWRIPSSDVVAPVLSHDGRFLLTVTSRGDRFTLRLHDLVRGTTRRIPYVRPPQLRKPGDVPDEWVYWAPDNDSYVLSGRARRLLDLDTGKVSTLPTAGVTAGLAVGGRAVTVSYHNGRRVRPMTDVSAHVVEVATGRVRDIGLQPSTPWADSQISSGQATVSPDGSTLVVAPAADKSLRYFSLSTGKETASQRVKDPGAYPRPYAYRWSDGNLTLPLEGPGDGGSTAQLTPDGPRTLVLIHPADESPNPTVTWATDAISGTAHRTPLGTVALWWSTWHKPGLIALAALAAISGWIIIFRGYRDTRS